ncbi:MAG: hypothetical protein WC071_05455 [Victivallaceae bacterium]
MKRITKIVLSAIASGIFADISSAAYASVFKAGVTESSLCPYARQTKTITMRNLITRNCYFLLA